MAYIWINPVVRQMYDKKNLDLFLENQGYQQVECQQDWMRYVRKEYGRLVEESKYPVVDVRCPAISQLLKKEYREVNIIIPEIEPILMHCAREMSEREDLKDHEKLIITPCQALANMGNEACLPNTFFLSWKEFLGKIKEKPLAKKLEASPIPPGFFEELKCPTISITGQSNVRDYLEKGDYRENHMIELLWCRDGCHHGDGVMDLE